MIKNISAGECFRSPALPQLRLNPYDIEQRKELMQYCRERDASLNRFGSVYRVYGDEKMGFIDIWSMPWSLSGSRRRGSLCWFYTRVWIDGDIGPLASIIIL